MELENVLDLQDLTATKAEKFLEMKVLELWKPILQVSLSSFYYNTDIVGLAVFVLTFALLLSICWLAREFWRFLNRLCQPSSSCFQEPKHPVSEATREQSILAGRAEIRHKRFSPSAMSSYEHAEPKESPPDIADLATVKVVGTAFGSEVKAHLVAPCKFAFTFGERLLKVAHSYDSQSYTRTLRTKKSRQGYAWVMKDLSLDILDRKSPCQFTELPEGGAVLALDESRSVHGADFHNSYQFLLHDDLNRLEIRSRSTFDRND